MATTQSPGAGHSPAVRPTLKPAYTASRSPVPDERSLGTLAGYPGGADKVGNWVNQQFQLDALAEPGHPARRGGDLASDGYLYRFRPTSGRWRRPRARS